TAKPGFSSNTLSSVPAGPAASCGGAWPGAAAITCWGTSPGETLSRKGGVDALGAPAGGARATPSGRTGNVASAAAAGGGSGGAGVERVLGRRRADQRAQRSAQFDAGSVAPDYLRGEEVRLADESRDEARRRAQVHVARGPDLLDAPLIQDGHPVGYAQRLLLL